MDGVKAWMVAWGEFFIDDLLVRIHLITEMVLVDLPCAMGVRIPFSRWPCLPTSARGFEIAGLGCEVEGVVSVFRVQCSGCRVQGLQGYLVHNNQLPPLGPPQDSR
jgi:hypothetical protein